MTEANLNPNTESLNTSPGPSTESPNTSPNRDTDTGIDPTAPTVPVTPLAQAEPGEKTAPTASAVPMAVPTQPPSKRRPLFPTILWGAMMLALAAFFAALELVPGGLDLVTWLLTAVVGIGLLLVVAGIIAASRRAG